MSKKNKKILILGVTGQDGSFMARFLLGKNFIREDWNALNVLTQQASRVGALDLGFYSINEKDNFSAKL